MIHEDKPLVIGGKTLKSRFILGTGKYDMHETMVKAIEASATEIVTVAIRRIDISEDRPEKNIIDYLDLDRIQLLPNTAGCYTLEDALRVSRLARGLGITNWIKLEVIGDEKTLLPDVGATIEGTKILTDEGFIVLPYTNDDPIAARKLVEAGAATVMPLASPIGSGHGLIDFSGIKLIIEDPAITVPVVVDAGLGVPSDAAQAMELGADAVLVNTAIAEAGDPEKMAKGFRLGVEAGRIGYLAGRIEKKVYASASSPMAGRVNE
ncbi:thiazole synthase [bacterium]|nr:thiazole synthase [bacterium]